MKLSIGSSIRTLRRSHGITQEKLADALGVSAQAVSRWEAGATYPDMEMVPAIANYFGVSIDRLFGYSAEREKKIDEILQLTETLNDESWRDDTNLDECISLVRRGLEEFPGNERLMKRLALLLKQAGWTRHREWLAYGEDGHLQSDFDRHRKNPYWQEAIEIFGRLAADASDREIRYGAAADLVLLSAAVGELERARQAAEAMPALAQSREILLAEGANGAERTRYNAEACIALLNAFRVRLIYAMMNEKANFDTEIPIHKLRGLIAVYQLLFEDGNMGPQHANVCELYLYLSRFLWEHGYKEAAFEALDEALKHAKKFDALTEADGYTALIVRHAQLKMPSVKPGDLARNLPDDWPMWRLPSCTAVAKEMKADPRWNEWVRSARG